MTGPLVSAYSRVGNGAGHSTTRRIHAKDPHDPIAGPKWKMERGDHSRPSHRTHNSSGLVFDRGRAMHAETESKVLIAADDINGVAMKSKTCQRVKRWHVRSASMQASMHSHDTG